MRWFASLPLEWNRSLTETSDVGDDEGELRSLVQGSQYQGLAPSAGSAIQVKRGALARSPLHFGWKAWRQILARIWRNSGEHDLAFLSAGVAFYAFLSFVPLLGALLMSYGLLADPSSIAEHMRVIIDLVPAAAAELIYGQLTSLAETAAGKKGLALLIALCVSIYGASRASGAMVGSLNIIYEQRDRRGFLKKLALSSLLTAGAVLIGLVGAGAASLLSFTHTLAADTGRIGAAVIQIITFTLAGALASFAFAGLYRLAPHRADARWRWLTLGSILATILWLLATLGFGFYASRFGNYDATYGSLGAVVVMLMWLYVSAYAVLLGALVNAEVERQTAEDTTTGAARPLGTRGATMADTSAALDQPDG